MSKKKNILKTAARLFAEQGYEGTTTIQIAMEADITEPLIYYHFKGKADIFQYILKTTFDEYYQRLGTLEEKESQFEMIQDLIELQFEFAEEMPHETYLGLSICPAKLRELNEICAENVKRQRTWLKLFLMKCLEKGIERGELHEVPVKGTASLLAAMINAVIRQRGLGLEDAPAMMEATVDFCRRSLVRKTRD
jgi:AcrR family transcriptional regulator